MRDVARHLASPDDIANAGEEIYAAKYKARCEKEHGGQFVAVDVVGEEAAYLGRFAEDALLAARKASPHGVFHLIRVGAPTALKVRAVGRRTSVSSGDVLPDEVVAEPTSDGHKVVGDVGVV